MLLVLGGIAIWWFIKGNEASGNEEPESENCDVRPKYVFYFIADGMGQGYVEAAQKYNLQVLKSEQQLLMMQFPVQAVVTTHSASDKITDSAAAGTALATGCKANRDAVGVSHDNKKPQSIAQLLKCAGWGVGIVTSVCPDDATPAAFYAHQPSRFNYYEIGKELAASDFDFVAGSKLRAFEKDGKGTSLMELLKENNVSVVRGFESLENAKSPKILLLSADSDKQNVGYTIDSIKGALNLPQMTQACLEHLKKYSPDCFFMMVEGGNIDYAGHINDGGAAVKEVINFNQAIKVAYDFYLKHPQETLIVVTSDHDTGGLHLTDGEIAYVDFQRMSKDVMGDYNKEVLKSSRACEWNDMKGFLSDKLGFWSKIPINDQQEKRLINKFNDIFVLRKPSVQKSRYSTVDDFTAEVYKMFNTMAGIGWTSDEHTGAKVNVYAIGVGADRFAKVKDNIHIYQELNIITR